jgi:hypothetical protein
MAITSFIKSLSLINEPTEIVAMHIIGNSAWDFVAIVTMSVIERLKQMSNIEYGTRKIQ